MTAVKVDNAQPASAHAEVAVAINALVVRTAVADRLEHARDQHRVSGPLTIIMQIAGNSAHSRIYLWLRIRELSSEKWPIWAGAFCHLNPSTIESDIQPPRTRFPNTRSSTGAQPYASATNSLSVCKLVLGGF